MKLLLIIAIVAVLSIVVLSIARGRTRVTQIDHHRERDEDDAVR